MKNSRGLVGKLAGPSYPTSPTLPPVTSGIPAFCSPPVSPFISKLKSASIQLRPFSFLDPKPELPYKRGLFDHVSSKCERGERVIGWIPHAPFGWANTLLDPYKKETFP